MSLLDGPSEQGVLLARSTRWREKTAQILLRKFSDAYPQITYNFYRDSRSINAQAWKINSKRHVSLYGGLVRHQAMKWQGVALAVAHETGHHLGGKPRDPDLKWLTWEGQADYWAAAVGIPTVFGDRALSITLKGARQICELHENISDLLGDEPDLPAACRNQIFWAAAHGLAIPDCAKREYEQSFSRCYPES